MSDTSDMTNGMPDTLNCYNEDDKCESCGRSPIEFIHWGTLTNSEIKKFCKDCFKKLCEKEQQTTRSEL
jgi:predicted Fe-S protein YdhL (DUF1289 family)